MKSKGPMSKIWLTGSSSVWKEVRRDLAQGNDGPWNGLQAIPIAA